MIDHINIDWLSI